MAGIVSLKEVEVYLKFSPKLVSLNPVLIVFLARSGRSASDCGATLAFTALSAGD